MINQDNINTFKKVFTSLDKGQFLGMQDCFANEVKWDYTQLGGINKTIPSSEILNQLIMLRGFDSTKHVLTNVQSDGNKISGDIHASHYLNDQEGIVTGTYLVALNDNHKINAWSITNAKLSGDVASFGAATKKVLEGNGRKLA